MSSIISTALCEIHPQLRVANLYVKLSNNATISNSNISVKENSICLGDEEALIKFPISVKLLDNYKFQANIIDEEYIHLRMPIGVPLTSGSTSTEVLDLLSLTNNYIPITKSRIFHPTIGKDYRIECAECQNSIVDSVCFKRVLPLPRATWSEAAFDWYCHADEVNQTKLIPRLTDCLYSSCYYTFAANLLIGLDDHGRKESLCSKCQSTIGLMIGDDLCNIWCHSIRWMDDMIITNPLQAFYFTLYDALEEEKSFFGRKLAFQDGSSTLLLWFVGDNGFTLESAENGIELQPSRLHKVLYKTTNDEKIASDVSEYQISGQMMNSVLIVLRDNSKLIPPTCRSAAGFSISYLSL